MDTLEKEQQVLTLGKCFLQTPYVANTLEKEGGERLVVNMGALDCTTFLENVVALYRVFSSPEPQFSGFVHELQHVRYREGEIKNYSSRLHYFTDWLYENQRKGIVVDITKSLGGVPLTDKVNFMSSNSSKYLSLKSDTVMVQCIRSIENKINKRKIYYIPKANIRDIEDQIPDGSLIGITTNIKGLDVVHVGMAIHFNGRLHFLHASSVAMKVVISDKPLSDMLESRSYQTGIVVGRVK